MAAAAPSAQVAGFEAAVRQQINGGVGVRNRRGDSRDCRDACQHVLEFHDDLGLFNADELLTPDDVAFITRLS